jgi:hypothetical protein
MEWCAPRGEFLIARGDQRRAKACEFGMARAIVGEKRFDRRTVGKLDGVFRVANDFFQAAKEKDFDPRGLYRQAHKRIVTCGSVPGHSLRS